MSSFAADLRRVLSRFVHERGRFELNTAAVSAAIGLVFLFEGFRVGFYEQLRQFPEQLPTPLVAMQAGVSRFVAERSVLPADARELVEAVPGVRGAHPLIGVPLIYEQAGRRTPVYVVAYDSVGAPESLVAGRQIAGEREVVVDEALASRHALGVGAKAEVLGVEFRVVGLSTDTASMFTPYVFARYVDVVDLYFSGAFADFAEDEATLLSYLLIELEGDADASVVRAEIERRVPAVDVFTREELAATNVALGRQMLGPILALLVGIAWSVGGLVIALTSYSSVAERLAELAVMKALGASARRLGADVGLEVAIVCSLGLVFGLAAALATAHGIQDWIPSYRLTPGAPGSIAVTGAVSVVLALAGGLVPLRQILAVDPASVFRA